MTKKYTELSTSNVHAFQADVVRAIKTALEPFGVTVDKNFLKYQTTSAELRLDLILAAGQGEVDEQRGMRWNTMCKFFGLKPEHFGLTIRTSKGPGKLVGFQPNRRKYPVEVELADGRRLLLQEYDVQSKVALLEKLAGA